MTKHEIADTFNRCIRKSEIYGYVFTFDQDEIASLYIDEDDCFYFDSVQTPYYVEDFKSIQYAKGTNVEPAYIRVLFHDNSELILRECLEIEFILRTCEGDTREYLHSTSSALQYLKAMGKARKLGILNDEFVVVDGNLLQYNGKDKTAILPEGIVDIKKSAFCSNTTVEEIIFPVSLKTIREASFRDCYHLKSITLPEGLTHIKWGAFANCALSGILKLPSTIAVIEGKVFQNCNLTAVIIDATNATIDPDAFNQGVKIYHPSAKLNQK